MEILHSPGVLLTTDSGCVFRLGDFGQVLSYISEEVQTSLDTVTAWNVPVYFGLGSTLCEHAVFFMAFLFLQIVDFPLFGAGQPGRASSLNDCITSLRGLWVSRAMQRKGNTVSKEAIARRLAEAFVEVSSHICETETSNGSASTDLLACTRSSHDYPHSAGNMQSAPVWTRHCFSERDSSGEGRDFPAHVGTGNQNQNSAFGVDTKEKENSVGARRNAGQVYLNQEGSIFPCALNGGRHDTQNSNGSNGFHADNGMNSTSSHVRSHREEVELGVEYSSGMDKKDLNLVREMPGFVRRLTIVDLIVIFCECQK